jgi:hypothetical protein
LGPTVAKKQIPEKIKAKVQPHLDKVLTKIEDISQKIMDNPEPVPEPQPQQ